MEKQNKVKLLLVAEPSIFIFLLPLFICIVSILYMVINKSSNFIISLLVFVPFFIFSYLNYIHKKIHLSNESIELINKDTVEFSVNFLDDFNIIEVRQTLLGKIFNYGSIVVVNKDNKYLQYNFIDNPLLFKENVIKVYVENVRVYVPDFSVPELELIKNEKNIDKIGS